MPAPNDLNSQIALKKGWTWDQHGTCLRLGVFAHWRNSQGIPARRRPNFTGTLEGVAGLLSDLADAPEGIYMLAPQATGWVCAVAGSWKPSHFSPPDHPGDCVGEAWLSVFEKEAIDVD